MIYKGLLILLAALPVIIILLLVYKKDKNKEPMALLIKLFLGGFLSCGLTLLLTEILELCFPFMGGTLESKSFFQLFLYAFIGVALVEEFSKWIMTYLYGYHHQEFDELYDGMIYAIFVSLGFAFVENIIYVVKLSSVNVALMRAISAVPSHACDAIFMGYYLSIAKYLSIRNKKEKEKKYLILSLVVPAIIHGIYDYCLMSGYQVLVIIFVIFVVAIYIVSIRKLRKIAKNSKKMDFNPKHCPKCGEIITGDYCPRCRTKRI